MVRMSMNEWKTVLGNIYADDEDVEIIWLESTDEWVLCCDCEIFEDGFKTEKQARNRLNEVIKKVYKEKK